MTRELSCEEVLKELYCFIDGEVSEELARDIDQHIHKCHECFGRAEFERRLKNRIGETGESTVPDTLKSRLDDIFKNQIKGT